MVRPIELGDGGLDLPASEAASRKAIQILETRTATASVAGATNQDFANVASLAANWDTLGWIDYKENKLPEAESYVRSAWLLLAGDPEGGEHMGKVYEAEGKKEDALTTYRLSGEVHGDTATVTQLCRHESGDGRHGLQRSEGRRA